MPRKFTGDYVRTNIYVTKASYKTLEKLSEDRDASIAALIRRAIKEFIERNPLKR